MWNYPIFDSVKKVPRMVWHNPDLVVERFQPERRDGFYCMRTWVFLGDAESHFVLYANQPIIKSGVAVRIDYTDEIPEEIRRIRRELGFEFGNFDYGIVDGRPVLYDANRTPAAPALPELVARLTALASGIESFFATAPDGGRPVNSGGFPPRRHYNAATLPRRTLLIICLIVMTTARSRAADEDSAKSWAFVSPRDYFFYNAMLDLRDLNETMAGQSGFVRISPEGDFLRGDGTPIRFWACGTEEFREDERDLTRHARFLAKLGVNMVRLHAQIGSDADAAELKEVNQKEIDNIRRTVAAFKRVGIYVTISPYWANDRPARRWGIKGYERESDLYGLLFFNPILQEGYKAWVRKLYDETNPYTGIPLARRSRGGDHSDPERRWNVFLDHGRDQGAAKNSAWQKIRGVARQKIRFAGQRGGCLE